MMSNYYRNSACSVRHVMLGVDDDGHRPVIDQSDPHMRALAGELDKTLKDLGIKEVRREYNDGSGWIVVDGFDFMAHIFLPEQRGLYGIEALWNDAENVDPESI